MSYLFTSESVSEGHPDKVADQISDALLDEFLKQDPESKVACETMVTTGLVVCSGEVRTNGWVDVQQVVRRVIRDIGYTRAAYKFEAESCGIISTIHEQSSDITQGVIRKKEEDQGAGDQGMMFGYANRDMDNGMPLPMELSHILLQELAAIRKEGKEMTYLRPDSKSQVTIEYEDNGKPKAIDTIVISTQHDEFIKPVSPAVTDCRIPTGVWPHMVGEHFLARMPRKSTAQQLMPHDILPITWWRPAWQMKCWSSLLMPSE